MDRVGSSFRATTAASALLRLQLRAVAVAAASAAVAAAAAALCTRLDSRTQGGRAHGFGDPLQHRDEQWYRTALARGLAVLLVGAREVAQGLGRCDGHWFVCITEQRRDAAHHARLTHRVAVRSHLHGSTSNAWAIHG